MILKYFGFDRIGKLFRIVRENGGYRKAFMKLWHMDDLKSGRLVGCDKYGNKYFENNYYFVGRNRWVEYSKQFNWDYDASQIPAEWYGWIHYRTDFPPNVDEKRPSYKWMKDHSENLSGTKESYMPYSTTAPKIQAWTPPPLPDCPKPLCSETNVDDEENVEKNEEKKKEEKCENK